MLGEYSFNNLIIAKNLKLGIKYKNFLKVRGLEELNNIFKINNKNVREKILSRINWNYSNPQYIDVDRQILRRNNHSIDILKGIKIFGELHKTIKWN